MNGTVTTVEAALLVVAGFAAGLVGSVAGLASMVSYPSLLAVGLSPVAANVTNTVGITCAGVGSTLGSRPELTGQGRSLRVPGLTAVAGGLAGGALLLVTPADAFEKLVPALIAGAALAVLARPRRISRSSPAGATRSSRSWASCSRRSTAATSARPPAS